MFTAIFQVIQLIIAQIAGVIFGIPSILTLTGITETGFHPLEMQLITLDCNIQKIDDIAMQSQESGMCMRDHLNESYLQKAPNGTRAIQLDNLVQIRDKCSGLFWRNCMVDQINKFFFK